MNLPAMLSYEQARQIVMREVAALGKTTVPETLPLREALGHIVAEPVLADRDYPPFDRSIRDGYAVHAADARAGAVLPCTGEIKAGDALMQPLTPGTCVAIMTGAAVPAGADAVVMIEHTRREGERVTFERTAQAGQSIVRRGSETSAGAVQLKAGQRLGYAETAIAAQVGKHEIAVRAKPRVAILSTGDEVVAMDTAPGPFQIRNSNNFSLAAQVRIAGGDPVELGNARDVAAEIRAKIEEGLGCDALVLSGGVSMGKYDLVEAALRELGTTFFFDSVAIRPGRPVVFGICRGVPVFGLPGNPVSTMVTFELFAVPALDILSGSAPRPLSLLPARLAEPMREKPGLAHFLPAQLDWTAGELHVRPLRWQGSGDITALAQANCFLVIDADKPELAVGAWVPVLPRRDLV